MEMVKSHSLLLVLLSYSVSVFGSYTALQLTSCIPNASEKTKPWWIAAAALALGGGAIWTMHFIGMLAYKTKMPVTYDIALTFLSLGIAIAIVGIGIYIVSVGKGSLTKLLTAGIVTGLGVSSMHYTGMSAMIMAADIIYNPMFIFLSVLISIIAAIISLWLSRKQTGVLYRLGSAFIMGVAVCGMHYTGMMGMKMVPNGDPLSIHASVSSLTLGLIIFCFSMLLLLLCLIVALTQLNRRMYKELEANADAAYIKLT